MRPLERLLNFTTSNPGQHEEEDEESIVHSNYGQWGKVHAYLLHQALAYTSMKMFKFRLQNLIVYGFSIQRVYT
jgi:hypothetical protein